MNGLWAISSVPEVGATSITEGPRQTCNDESKDLSWEHPGIKKASMTGTTNLHQLTTNPKCLVSSVILSRSSVSAEEHNTFRRTHTGTCFSSPQVRQSLYTLHYICVSLPRSHLSGALEFHQLPSSSVDHILSMCL